MGLIVLTANSFGQTKDSATTNTTIFADPMIYPSFPEDKQNLQNILTRILIGFGDN
jgi:hypothetical protein